MNAKITFVELVDLMAQATSSSKRVCELFLKDLFTTISQALIDGDSVKVKGVGTFKISRVKPRKSVNVKTGESMQIAGYSKVIFTPDKALAQAVNQPFEQFETVMLDDAMTDERLAEIDQQHPSAITDASQATDESPANAPKVHPEPAQEPETEPMRQPVDEDEQSVTDDVDVPAAPLPSDLPEMQDAAPAPAPDALFDGVLPDGDAAAGERPAEKKPAMKQPAMAKPVEEKKLHQPEPVKPAPEKPMPERKPMLVGRPIDGPSQPLPEPEEPEEVKVSRRFYRPEPRNAYTPTPEQIEEASRKTDRRWLWLLLSALAAVLIFWLIARGCSDSQVEEPEQEIVAADTITEAVADSLEKVKEKADAAKEKIELKTDKKSSESKAEAKPEPTKPKPENKPDKNGEVTDVVTSQIVLTTLSEKHYGSPWFWVYIYEENLNRGIINDPNNIRPGTRVVIPPAEKYGINPKDKASLKKAQYKSWEYLK